MWSVSDTFPLSAKPVVSHDDLFVYTTRVNGVIAAYDLESGEEIWSMTCADIEAFEQFPESVSRGPATCVDLIEAESSISPNGLVFFYGDKFGNVKALQLGDSTIATAAPSQFATFHPSGAPSSIPSDLPSSMPSTSPQPTGPPNTEPPIDWDTLLSTADSAIAAFEGTLLLRLMSVAMLAAYLAY